jgi:uncharacterized protein YndB with AHSA1/START domain
MPFEKYLFGNFKVTYIWVTKKLPIMSTARVQHKIFYESTPEIVWEYLTNPELMSLWLMKSDFKPELGYEFTFQGPKMPDLGFDGQIHCKVLELKPNERLSYTWNMGPGDGTISCNSVVTFSLKAINGGTEMSLEHVGTKVDYPTMFTLLDTGWLQNMQKIDKHIKASSHVGAGS